MNSRHGRAAVVFASFLGVVIAGPTVSRASESPSAGSTGASAADQDRELRELVRRTQELAEQANAELKSSREQNEALQRLLEQTRRELLELREEVGQLRSNVAARQQGGPSVAASAPGSDASTLPGPSKQEQPSADFAARLARVEDQVEVNAAQIKEQDQTKVESDSRFGVRLFGTILYNSFYNSSDTAEEAVPMVAPATSVRVANGGGNFGATLRQTSLGFALSGPRLGAARLSADVAFDFYGGTPGVYGSDPLGALRMRTAAARLDGKSTSLAMGLMAPMISPLNPTSLAAVYYPPLGDSGNLWQWRPQFTLERRITTGDSGKALIQGGLLMPSGENFYGKGLEGKPGAESRVAFARTIDPDRRLEVGVGGYIDPQQFGFGRTVNSYAVTGDWIVPINERLELRGEAYFGQSITLRDEAGGDISPFFSFTGGIDDPRSTFRGIHSTGGWIQLHAQASQKLEFNWAFGMDDPRNRDVFAGLFRSTSRLRNQTVSANSIYRLRSNFLLSLEYRYLATTYPDTRRQNNHFNLAVGYAF
jgi:hypothetical protein